MPDAAHTDGVTGIASIVIGSTMLFLMIDSNPLLGLTIYTGSYFFSISKMMSQYNNWQKAVWIYNREAAIPKE